MSGIEKRKFIFRPQSDITAYELAHIIKLLLPGANLDAILESMPKECMRHLGELGSKKIKGGRPTHD